MSDVTAGSASSRVEGLAARNGGRGILVALLVVLLAGLGLRVGFALDDGYAQPPDAQAYARLAESLYEEGSYDFRREGETRPVQPASSYAPGLPFFLTGVYALTGGVHETLGRVALALAGAASVLLTFLLGRRLAGPAAGLVAATAVAGYPVLLEYQALLLTEPLAALLLVGSLLAVLAARERASLPLGAAAGGLSACLALVRPEYLAVAVALALALLVPGRETPPLARRAGTAGVMILALAAVLAPWTARNAATLDRVVPVSTGGGKALFIGTSLAADGDGVQLRRLLLAEAPRLRERLRRRGLVRDPEAMVLERLLARVAAREYPLLDADVALARLGRQNLSEAVSHEPGRLAAMLAGKAWDTWTAWARPVMAKPPFRALQLGLLAAAIAGLLALAAARRFEALVLGGVILYVTAVGAVLIDSPRRALVLVPVVAALAGTGIVRAVAWARAAHRDRAAGGIAA